MSCKLNRAAYQKLVDEDVEWLLAQPRALERDHVIDIVKESVGYYYDHAQLAAQSAQIETLQKRVAELETIAKKAAAYRAECRQYPSRTRDVHRLGCELDAALKGQTDGK